MNRFFLLIFLAIELVAHASVETSQAHSVARLVSEDKIIAPGKTFAAGLYLEIEEGWHSYWENPGDSGAAPRFEWILPEGFSVEGPFFTTPQRIDVGELTSFGYPKEAFYRFEIKNNLKSPSSEPTVLALKAEWLICEKTCVPAKYRFEMRLAMKAEGEPSEDAPLIAKFQNLLPRPMELETIEWKESPESVRLRIASKEPWEVLDFFPSSAWQVNLQKPHIQNDGKTTEVIWSRKSESNIPQEPGVILYRKPGSERALGSMQITKTETGVLPGFLGAFLFAFLGGLLLNLMPCVFPVLSIKVFSVLEQAGKGKAWVRHSSLVYAAGILVSFTVLGVVLAALRSWGEAVGWGFQLQNPYLLVVLIFLFLCLGASFLGAIDLSWLQVGAGQGLANQSGWTGEFFSGVLCVIVASPCTAPFMGAALGYAISQPLPILMTVFLSLGVGLSFPYLVLATFPQAARILPRPGQWMEVVKEIMAFPLFATVIWLLWILAQSSTPFGMVGVLNCILISSIGLWAYHLKKKKPWVKRFGIGLGLIGMVAAFWVVRGQMQVEKTEAGESLSHGIKWKPFVEEQARELSLSGKAVFVDFTASWCVTCQVNEEVTFGNEGVREFVKEKEIVMMKADWTKADPLITEALKSYNRIGVPFYVVYDPDSGKGRGIGEILTPKIFKSAFESKTK